MKFEIELGPCNPNEEAVQLTKSGDFQEPMLAQCYEWKAQLQNLINQRWGENNGLTLKVKSFSHDFGVYYEVVVSCDDCDDDAVTRLFWLETNLGDA